MQTATINKTSVHNSATETSPKIMAFKAPSGLEIHLTDDYNPNLTNVASLTRKEAAILVRRLVSLGVCSPRRAQ